MRVIVTGATGFIGGAIARRYVGDADEVIGVGRNRAAGAELARDGVEFLRLDLAEAGTLASSFDGADLVIHCAGLASLKGTPEMFREANVVGTENVVDACIEVGVGRLVHMSSPSIYQTGESRVSIREEEPLPSEFINPYAATKHEAELVVEAGMDRGLDAVMLRPRAVFGPGDLAIVPRIIRTMKTGRLRVIGDGTNEVDVTYIDNLVDAVMLAAETDSPGGTYNITNGEPIRIWDFIDTIARELDLPAPSGNVSHRVARKLAGAVEDVHRKLRPRAEPPVTRYGVDVLGLSMTLDIEKARDELDYEPAVSVDEGLERLLAHYRAHGIPEVS